MKRKPIIETHGKVEGKPTTLEQVWGFNDLAKYGTRDETTYRSQIDEYNRTDLEQHARRVGVVIVESTARLKEKLVTEFKSYHSLLNKPMSDIPLAKGEVSNEVKRILAEGR